MVLQIILGNITGTAIALIIMTLMWKHSKQREENCKQECEKQEQEHSTTQRLMNIERIKAESRPYVCDKKDLFVNPMRRACDGIEEREN